MRGKIIGSGMSQRRVSTLVEIDSHGAREDRKLVEQGSIGGLAQFTADARSWAAGTLREAGLPDHEGKFVQLADGAFMDVVGMRHADVLKLDLLDGEALTIEKVVEKVGFAIDSAEGYAAAILACLHRAERSKAAARIDSAMEWSCRLGVLITEARLKFRWEVSALRGEKNGEALARNRIEANARRQADAQAEHAIWQAKADEYAKRYPSYGKNRIAGKIYDWLVEQNEAGTPLPIRSSDAIARRITIVRKAC